MACISLSACYSNPKNKNRLEAFQKGDILMSRHNMSGMDAASKLLMANEAVAKDAVNFILRKSGYAVVQGSMQLRNTEAIAIWTLSTTRSLE